MSDRSTDRLELCTDSCVILFIRNAKRKPVGAMGKISGVAESVILVRLFKKKELHAELRNTWKAWKTMDIFPWWRKSPSQQSARSRTASRRWAYLCQCQQPREDFTSVNAEALPQVCKPQKPMNRQDKDQLHGKRRVWRNAGTAHDLKRITLSYGVGANVRQWIWFPCIDDVSAD